MTVLRELIVKLGLDFNEQQWKRADQIVGGIASGANLVARAVQDAGRALVGSVQQTLNTADAASKLANRLGVASETLQEYQFAAKLADVESDEFARALTRMSAAQGEALAGNKEAADKFAELGIAFRDSAGKARPLNAVLDDFSDRMARAGDGAERNNLAAQMFGQKVGPKMINMLSQGSAAMAEQRKEARDLGGIISNELGVSAEEINDNFTRLDFALQGIKATMATEFVPILLEVTGGLIAWVKENRELLRQKVAQYAKDGARALVTIGKAAFYLAKVLGWVIEAFGGLRAAMIATGAVIGAALLVKLGAAAIALTTYTTSALAAAAATVALQAAAGLGVVALGALLAVLGEEIGASFDPDKDGFLEQMKGKWGELRSELIDGIGTDENPLVAFARLGMVGITTLVKHVDDGFGSIADAIIFVYDLTQNAGVYFDAFVAQVKRAAHEMSTAFMDEATAMAADVEAKVRALASWIAATIEGSPVFRVAIGAVNAAAGVAGAEGVGASPLTSLLGGLPRVVQPNMATTIAGATSDNSKTQNTFAPSIAVNVDASGGGYNEQTLTGTLERSMREVTDSLIGQALRANTPGAGA
jgi:hypothetical protein